MKRHLRRLLMSVFVFLAAGLTLSAQNVEPFYPGFTPLLESRAYQQFKARPASDYSKIIYLIDRFSDSKIQIVYDGHYFSAVFGARVARWFLARNYRKETPEQWIMKWCNASVPASNLIWVKLPTGKFRLSREVLIEELKNLEAHMTAKEEPVPAATLEISPLAVAQIVDTPAQAPPLEAVPQQPLRNTKPAKPQPLAS